MGAVEHKKITNECCARRRMMYSPHVVNTNDFSSQFRTNIDSAHNGPLKSGSAECDVKRILVTDWSAGIWIQISLAVLNEIQS